MSREELIEAMKGKGMTDEGIADWLGGQESKKSKV